jgi:hypothetical protein
MGRHNPRAPKHVVSLGKVCDGRLHLRKERSKLVDQGKWLKETRLVSNSSFFNGDLGITGLVIPIFGKQIIVPPLVYFPAYLLVLLCFLVISYYVLHCIYSVN